MSDQLFGLKSSEPTLTHLGETLTETNRHCAANLYIIILGKQYISNKLTATCQHDVLFCDCGTGKRLDQHV